MNSFYGWNKNTEADTSNHAIDFAEDNYPSTFASSKNTNSSSSSTTRANNNNSKRNYQNVQDEEMIIQQSDLHIRDSDEERYSFFICGSIWYSFFVGLTETSSLLKACKKENLHR
jgi:hypothetical protein